MNQYHKIQTVFKRDPGNMRELLMGDFSLPEFDYLSGNQWVWDEKVDGTNIRVPWDGSTIAFKGKTEKANTPQFLLDKLAEIFDPLLPVFRDIFPGNPDVCLYGEGYGGKIQKGGKYRQDPSFILFDIKVGFWWLKRKDVQEIARQLGIDVVPIVGQGTLWEMIRFVQDGFRSAWGDFTAEGVVARPAVELKARNGERIITKLKHRDFTNEAALIA